MNNRIKRAAFIIIFGSVWGGSEMFLGGFLHALHIPMRGMIMSCVGAFVRISANFWAGGRGISLTIGCIAAFLKLFSLGGLVLSPAVAIIFESAIAEVVFGVFKYGSTASMLTGAGIVVYTVIHRFGAMLLIYRNEISEIWETFYSDGSIFSKIGVKSLLIVLILYVMIHLFLGAAVGLAAYYTVHKADKRIG